MNVYAPSYHVHEDLVSLTIYNGEVIVDEINNANGSYVVNLSDNHFISFEETSYGKDLIEFLYLENSLVGIYKISNRTDLLIFDFDKNPPEQMRSKRNSLFEKTFINLKVKSMN